VLSALLLLRLSASSHTKHRVGLTVVVILTVTAQIHEGYASRASADTPRLANIAHTVTAYFSSLILARPYTPLSWLWRVCRLFSFPCILRESLSMGDQ
jgi:hypothetical protein